MKALKRTVLLTLLSQIARSTEFYSAPSVDNNDQRTTSPYN